MMKKIYINGMTCEHCVKRVTAALMELQGVEEVSISLAEGTAEIKINAEIEDSEIIEAIDEAGYDVIKIV